MESVQRVLLLAFNTLHLSDSEVALLVIFLVLNILVPHLCTFMSVHYALFYQKSLCIMVLCCD